MKMEGNRVRLRKEGLSLQVLSAYPGTLSLTFTLPYRIQDVIQECQDDSLSPRAQRRAHMHCFKAKLKHIKRPLYAEVCSFVSLSETS